MSDSPDADELHKEAIEAVHEAHAGFLVTVKFGRDDNDIPEGTVGDSCIGFVKYDDLTTTELIAARTLINEQLDDFGKIGEVGDDDDEPDVVGAVAVPSDLHDALAADDGDGESDSDDSDGTRIGFK